ncbi:oligosaccharide flippase family protein [Cryptosporangium aurantiacum]|uniref:Polysaccharide biosynthesis protein n=1 Tax=Cryptosporangium aurantiacum TaxID=134849 RepID=A0A1M7IE34_9ACTN|nr:oligosaccharide flippase family protein [Cryptosporangium aurantiacum]SHM38950.1 Polysaccharide biosynthesis protein [Cryptosporangium aurantiacum]
MSAPQSTSSAAARFAAGATLVAAAAMAANVLAYGLRLGGNWLLDTDENGALGALIALLTVATVLQVGTQTVAAVRTAKGTSDPDRLVTTGIRLSVATSAVLVLASPVLAAVLHLPSVWPAVALAAAVGPLNAAGIHLGLLQGAERFGRLAILTGVVAVGRSGGGLIGLVLGRSAFWTLLGVAVGGALALVAAYALSRPVRQASGVGSPRIGEVLGACSAMLAMLALVNADLLLARAVLPAEVSGEYAVGAILTNAAYWAPQVVAVVALPRLAQGQRRALLVSGLVVATTGLIGVLATVVAGDLAVRVAGKGEYAGLADEVWLFAAAGAGWALVNLFLTARIAAGYRWVAAPLWAAAAVEAVAVLTWRPYSLTHTAVVALATAVGSVLVAVVLLRVGSAAAHRVAEPATLAG